MKEIKDMSIKELEAIAGDKSIAVPESLSADISATLNALELVGNGAGRHPRILLTACSIAASIALLVFAGMGVAGSSPRPKDTFDDPYMAYAQLEKAFDLISTKMQDIGEASLSGSDRSFDVE